MSGDPPIDQRPEWLRGPFPYQDPTKLTTDAVNKLQLEIEDRLKNLQDLLESKLESVKGIHEQKFEGIKTQFLSNDAALQNAFKSNKDLIDAQNKANTDAAKKTEEAFSEQIKALTTFMNASFQSINKSVDDLKTMVISTGAADKGAAANSAKIMAAVALAITVIGFLFVISSHAWNPILPISGLPSGSLQAIPK